MPEFVDPVALGHGAESVGLERLVREGHGETVLVEGYSEETDLLLKGRSVRQAPDVDGQYLITDGQADVGQMVQLKITDSSEYDLIGEIVEE